MLSDAELFATIRSNLYTAVVGDVLDHMGHRLHFLPPAIRALRFADEPDICLAPMETSTAISLVSSHVSDSRRPAKRRWIP